MKALAGHWEGSSNEGKMEEKVAVDYKLTSGGTAMLETLFPGTPHEMISVYHDQAGKLMMSHYCMLGNQPLMELKKADANAMNFELAKGGTIDPKKDTHMHGLSIAFLDPDKITHWWSFYENGRQTKTTIFQLMRVK